MASADPPGWYPVWKTFAERGDSIYLIEGDSSFELARDPATRVWRFESELDIRDDDGERRRFDARTTYPQAMNDRVARVAALLRGYCDLEVDERIGVAAFGRLGTHDRWH